PSPSHPEFPVANFPTHVLGATGAGIVAATALASTDLLPLPSIAAGVGLTVLGGVFPDVDSDHSDAITLVFDTLAVAVAIPLTLLVVPALGMVAGLGLLGATWLFLRYVAIWPFRVFTVHRGRFHSLPAGALLAAAVAAIGSRAVGLDPVQAWLMGGLFALGFVVHLTLDELFSVDLGNRKIKASFGTALKLFERGDWLGYGLLYAAVAVAFAAAPPTQPVAQAVAAVEVRWLPPEGALPLDPLAAR
ncbi:MAG: metal-dependent hydrolase, partial [Myxococcota bacterium]